MTTKKTTSKLPIEATKPRSSRINSDVDSKSKASQNVLQEVMEVSIEAKVAKLEKELANTRGELTLAKKEVQALTKSFTTQVNYYKDLWTTSEQDLDDLEQEPWYAFVKYRVKRWFKEVFEVESANV